MRFFGYAGRILRVDLGEGDRAGHKTGAVVVEPLDVKDALRHIGGRGLNVARLTREIDLDVDPLSPENLLIIGVGPLDGTLFPGACRVNFTSKSPQTGILGDSNAGGFFGPELKFAGYDQVVVSGRAKTLSYLLISDGDTRVIPARDLAGLDVWETQRLLLDRHGRRAQVACVGPAAERGVRFSGIFCNLARPAARTGMGTVLASKNLKAVVVRGKRPVEVAHPDEFLDFVRALDTKILSHPEYGPRVALGTTRLVSALNAAGCLATRHFQTGRFEHAPAVSGETLAARLRVKSKACFSCTIPCSRFFEVKSGPYAGLKSEGPEFEGLAAFTSRVGSNDLEAGLATLDMCNRAGMDVISTAECVSFAMECFQRGIISKQEADGLDLTWGNIDAVQTLVRKIASREGFGDVLADGVREAARKIGRGSEDLAMHVKGLEIFMADPRGIKGYALGNAVASRGGDHLRSEPSFEFTQDAAAAVRRFGTKEAAFRLEHKGKGRVVKHFEELCALADSLDACKNTIVNMEVLPFDEAATVLRAATGLDFDETAVQAACERTVNLERCLIVALGVRRKDDTLPRRFREEPMPAGCGATTGATVALDEMLDEYYEARGWDAGTGVPTASTLERLGLHEWVTRLASRGVPVAGRLESL
ncbi:MAG: aldehyde ferredoxin oxidoreductase family protein [Firmicutes bacterium]|nr:aldehyde ferredoxin oxidoreductase family protein [Bacillota bacterium]MDH7496554.1 aldehyde ferredoxin oxidoreductase family protein [Bacillota bacterium]